MGRDYEKRSLDLHTYIQLVQIYCERNLSYQSDMLTAFAGIVNRVQSELGINIQYGHPLGAPFLLSLCWEILPLDDQGASPKSRRDGFPSWSWLGWHGKPSWYDVMDLCKASFEDTPVRPKPILVIHTDRIKTSVRFRHIDGGYLRLNTEKVTLVLILLYLCYRHTDIDLNSVAVERTLVS